MKTYSVTIPITGIIYVEVEADSRKEAIEKAMDLDFQSKDIEEWETHKQIVQGNVFYGVRNEATADEI